MIGIVGLGCYVPRYRLTGEGFAAAWGGSKSGQRSVANHDEDSLTMACEAALECLDGHDPAGVGRVYFASTSHPYLEHQNASMVAAVADLGTEVMAADFAGSVRAGTTAVRAARDAVAADGDGKALVLAADLRLASPGDAAERSIGDAAAALLIGKDDPYAVFKGFHSSSKVFIDHWRKSGDPYIQSGDAKFINDMGIMTILPEAVNNTLDALDLARDEISRVVYYSPDMRLRRGLDKKLGFPGEAYLQDNPQAKIGDAGSAQVILGLIAALAKAKPGDLILVAGYSSGADAFVLEATDRVSELKTSLAGQIEAGRTLSSYARYLQFRGQLPTEDINVWASPPVLWREEKVNVRRIGGKCVSCGAINYPPRPICYNCDGRQMEDYKISRTGEVFTFTLDSLVPNPDALTPMVSVDLDGGARLYAQMTDTNPAEVEIGMKVEMVFRRLHQGGGYNNYFWKFRPKV